MGKETLNNIFIFIISLHLMPNCRLVLFLSTRPLCLILRRINPTRQTTGWVWSAMCSPPMTVAWLAPPCAALWMVCARILEESGGVRWWKQAASCSLSWFFCLQGCNRKTCDSWRPKPRHYSVSLSFLFSLTTAYPSILLVISTYIHPLVSVFFLF